MIVLAVALAAALVASGSPAGSATASAEERRPTVVVRMERSGGFAGWTSRITVTSDGRAHVVDTDGVRSTFALTAPERRRVDRRLDAADLPHIAGTYTTPGAADLYVYSITGDGSLLVADQIALPSRVQPLVDTLTRLLTSGRGSVASTVR